MSESNDVKTSWAAHVLGIASRGESVCVSGCERAQSALRVLITTAIDLSIPVRRFETDPVDGSCKMLINSPTGYTTIIVSLGVLDSSWSTSRLVWGDDSLDWSLDDSVSKSVPEYKTDMRLDPSPCCGGTGCKRDGPCDEGNVRLDRFVEYVQEERRRAGLKGIAGGAPPFDGKSAFIGKADVERAHRVGDACRKSLIEELEKRHAALHTRPVADTPIGS